jgi:uncharacterized protein (DUF3820 family)
MCPLPDASKTSEKDEKVKITNTRWLRSLNDPLPFGKYQGLTLQQIYRKNPGYIVWLYDNTIISYKDAKAQRLFTKLGARKVPAQHVFSDFDTPLGFGRHATWTLRDLSTVYSPYLIWLVNEKVIRMTKKSNQRALERMAYVAAFAARLDNANPGPSLDTDR